MSRVDLDRNRSTLLEAFDEVFNAKSDTNWVLYGYEGQTSVLKVVSKGDGGIEELMEDLSSGKIMYAYCRVQDPNTSLPKFVLINWQGEGVPEIKKGSCAGHITDVAKLLKGAHITINARSEDDVDEDDILKKVAKSSGCNYSFHKEKAQPGMNAPTGPVGSVYQKTRPHQEIKSNQRDQFWQKQQEDEKKRQEDLQQKAMVEKQTLDKEVKEREAKETQVRDSREQERIWKINETKVAEKRAIAAKDADKKAEWEQSQVEAMRDDEERKKRAEKLRKERANEAQSLVQQRDNNPRALFEQKPASQFDEPARAPPPPRKIKHGVFGEEPTSQFDEPKKPIQLPKEEPTSPVESQPPVPPPQRQLPQVPAHEPEPEPTSPVSAPAPAISAPAPAISAPTSSLPPTRNILAEGLPKRQDSDEEDDQNWDASKPHNEPSTEDVSVPVASPAPQHVQQEQELYDDVRIAPEEPPQDLYDDVRNPPAVEDNQDLYDDVRNPPAVEDNQDVKTESNVQISPEQGVVARALYDYQATEENEVTFDPGDIITNIDRIDPGWWVGTTPDGSQGMFPSNYVELLNG